MQKNYYSIVGVSLNATQDEIKFAYRNIAKKYHPDVNSLPEAEEIFKEATEAYEELSDINKRQRYDSTLGISPNASSRAYSSYTKSREESENIFESFIAEYLRIRRENQGKQGKNKDYKWEKQQLEDLKETLVSNYALLFDTSLDIDFNIKHNKIL